MTWSPPPPTLRPLGVGERLDASFKVFGRNFVSMAKAVLVIAIPAGVLEALISVSTALPQTSSIDSPLGGTTLHVSASDAWSYASGVLLVLVVVQIVTAIATAACYRIIAGAYLGQPTQWWDALRYGATRMFSIIWIIALTLLGIVIPALGVGIVIAILAAIHLPVVAIVLSVLAGLGWIVYTIWFAVCTRLAVPTLMLEDVRGSKALQRSISLCRGKWWSVFGTEFLAGVIVEIFSAVLGGAAAILLVTSHDSTVVEAIVDFFSRTVSLVVATPFSAAVLVILSIDLRVRKEGFDIQLLASRMGMDSTTSAMSFLSPPPQYPPPGYPPQYPPPQYPGSGYPPQYPPPPPQYPSPGYPPPPPGPPQYQPLLDAGSPSSTLPPLQPGWVQGPSGGQPVAPPGYSPPGYVPPGYVPPGSLPPGSVPTDPTPPPRPSAAPLPDPPSDGPPSEAR